MEKLLTFKLFKLPIIKTEKIINVPRFKFQNESRCHGLFESN